MIFNITLTNRNNDKGFYFLKDQRIIKNKTQTLWLYS
jgi:hypothetical protein